MTSGGCAKTLILIGFPVGAGSDSRENWPLVPFPRSVDLAPARNPDPADPTPRPHPGDQSPIAGGVRRELVGSQQAACVIHHRSYMCIPMCVNPANHTYPVGPYLLCHDALPFVGCLESNSLSRAEQRTEHSRWRTRRLLLGHPAPRFRGVFPRPETGRQIIEKAQRPVCQRVRPVPGPGPLPV